MSRFAAPESSPSRPALDPLLAARRRGEALKPKLLERAGGALSARAAASRLGISPGAVSARRRRGQLLGVRIGSGGYLYPAFQFTRGGVLEGLPRVLDAFRVQGSWTRLSVLLSPADALGGRTPVDALRDGDVEGAVQAVCTYGEHLG